MAKDEGHGYQKKSNQDFQFYASVLFLKQSLLQLSLIHISEPTRPY